MLANKPIRVLLNVPLKSITLHFQYTQFHNFAKTKHTHENKATPEIKPIQMYQVRKMLLIKKYLLIFFHWLIFAEKPSP